MNGDDRPEQALNGSNDIGHIQKALGISYDPRADRDARQQALAYLEQLMGSDEAPQYGFTLANDASLPTQARHFGLSLLDAAVTQRWDHHTSEQASIIRDWITHLGQHLRHEDASYLRSKIASLWVSLAERVWGATWLDMDMMLQKMWDVDGPEKVARRSFVLYILECLSDDICVRERPLAMLRSETLGHALNEIFNTPQVSAKHQEQKLKSSSVRNGEPGWLSRICDMLLTLTPDNPHTGVNGAETVLVRALEALKPTVPWISLDCVIEARCIDGIFQTLTHGNDNITVASVELLLAILSRSFNVHFASAWRVIHRSIVSEGRIDILRRVFRAAQTQSDDIDPCKYTIQKKLAEVISLLAEALSRSDNIFDGEQHITTFYEFALEIFGNDSLLVSIPVLHSVSRVFSIKNGALISILHQASNILITTCVERLIRFESLPTETEHPILIYLREDFETLPELHGFLGNYRRYCTIVIEGISMSHPIEALDYLLGLVETSAEEVKKITASNYNKNAIPVVQIEANLTAAKSGLSGYSSWVVSIRANLARLAEMGKESEDARAAAQSESTALSQQLVSSAAEFDKRCEQICKIHPSCPDVARVYCRILAEMLLRRSDQPSSGVVTFIFAHIMNIRVSTSQANVDYEEAVKNFEAERLAQMQRLALYMSDALYEQHEDLFRSLDMFLSEVKVENKLVWAYKSIPAILIHRSNVLDAQTRVRQLQPILEPMLHHWQSPEFNSQISSFQGFFALLGFDQLNSYVVDAHFATTSNWSAQKLDQRGLALRDHITASFDALPLRMTQSLLNATTESLRADTTYHVTCVLWENKFPEILRPMLTLLQHATAFCNEDNWSQFSPDVKLVLRRMMIDRFWQSGISGESRDEFAARVTGSSDSFEGLASAVRGSPRQIRDACYHIIHGMTRLPSFFSIPELPQHLAKAILGDAQSLSTHHLQRLVSLLDRLVDKCPGAARASFLPPVLGPAFTCFQHKLIREWEAVSAAQAQETETETDGETRLGEEMRADSVVRTTTHAFVTFTHKLLMRVVSADTQFSDSQRRQTTRFILLSDEHTVGPAISFLISALRMRDSRSASIASMALRSILGPLTGATPDPKAPNTDPAAMSVNPERAQQIAHEICTNGLQTAIMSMNEQHFVDIQKELAVLIAAIISRYSGVTDLPAQVLKSLQGMDAGRVDAAIQKILSESKEREQRAAVLGLLEGIRGVRVSEMGKIGVTGTKEERSKRDVQKWTTAVSDGDMQAQASGIVRGNTPPDGLAGMFGE